MTYLISKTGMAKRQDIDAILQSWKHEPGEVSARVIQAGDGRMIVQMRVEMGLLQMEVAGRPDGARIEGFETSLDYLRNRELLEGERFALSEEDCLEADREFVQFYHRRMCWLALREFERAVEDADHTLALMDFCTEHSDDQDWILSHEQYRPFVMFHRTQAAALARLEEDDAEQAIDEISSGLHRFRQLFEQFEIAERYDEDELVVRLTDLQTSIREHYDVGRTLPERLQDAVVSENYELAARLRDELAKREGNGRL